MTNSAETDLVRYATTTCSLGTLGIAATANGLRAAFLSDGTESSIRDLLAEFPDAVPGSDEERISRLCESLAKSVENPAIESGVPLDIQGTDFRKNVWQEIRRIPPRTTITYTELARQCGCPDAVRAVASACASNTIAVAIPCHRVIRSDGSVSGYRWGLDRKQAVIDREAGTRTAQATLFEIESP